MIFNKNQKIRYHLCKYDFRDIVGFEPWPTLREAASYANHWAFLLGRLDQCWSRLYVMLEYFFDFFACHWLLAGLLLFLARINILHFGVLVWVYLLTKLQPAYEFLVWRLNAAGITVFFFGIHFTRLSRIRCYTQLIGKHKCLALIALVVWSLLLNLKAPGWK